jgi:hypothetical protein
MQKGIIVKVTDPETKKVTEMDVWFAKDLNLNNGFAKGPLKKIEGAMLEFSLEQQGMNMNFQASSITKQKVDDQMFEVPEGLQENDARRLDENDGWKVDFRLLIKL